MLFTRTRNTLDRTNKARDFKQAQAVFLDQYPDYKTTEMLDRLRLAEFSRLDLQGHTYLDFTGGGMYAASQVEAHMKLLRENVYGNPHSSNPTSHHATEHTESARN